MQELPLGNKRSNPTAKVISQLTIGTNTKIKDTKGHIVVPRQRCATQRRAWLAHLRASPHWETYLVNNIVWISIRMTHLKRYAITEAHSRDRHDLSDVHNWAPRK
ncbi:hypothetical protein SAMN05518849_11575 [Sphingobium sp. AP50]|nr:hypothetical protein SAMN05518849_11575 [Sphingobium sp. AP50]